VVLAASIHHGAIMMEPQEVSCEIRGLNEQLGRLLFTSRLLGVAGGRGQPRRAAASPAGFIDQPPSSRRGAQPIVNGTAARGSDPDAQGSSDSGRRAAQVSANTRDTDICTVNVAAGTTVTANFALVFPHEPGGPDQ